MAEPPKDLRDEHLWQRYEIAVLLASSGDVSILMSVDRVVLEVIVPDDDMFDAHIGSKWQGRDFNQLVANDSAAKIEPLLSENANTAANGVHL